MGDFYVDYSDQSEALFITEVHSDNSARLAQSLTKSHYSSESAIRRVRSIIANKSKKNNQITAFYIKGELNNQELSEISSILENNPPILLLDLSEMTTKQPSFNFHNFMKFLSKNNELVGIKNGQWPLSQEHHKKLDQNYERYMRNERIYYLGEGIKETKKLILDMVKAYESNRSRPRQARTNSQRSNACWQLKELCQPKSNTTGTDIILELIRYRNEAQKHHNEKGYVNRFKRLVRKIGPMHRLASGLETKSHLVEHINNILLEMGFDEKAEREFLKKHPTPHQEEKIKNTSQQPKQR